MDQKNILPRGIAKPIEQQPDGTWIVRHHFRVVGTSENGEELECRAGGKGSKERRRRKSRY